MDVGAARVRALLGELDAARSNPGVAQVHQIRVACRRVRQTLDVLAPMLPKKLRRQARRAATSIRRYFGPARDADVSMQHLHAWLASRPPQHLGATCAAELITQLAQDRRDATHILLATLRGPEALTHVRALNAMLTWCTHPQDRKERKTQSAPSSEVGSVRAARTRVDRMLAQQPLDTTPEGLLHSHDLRNVVKLVRYGLETVPGGKSAMHHFGVCQDALGEVQDMCILIDGIDATLKQTPDVTEPGLEHLNRRTGLLALRADILATVGQHFGTFERSYAKATAVLDALA